jgi:hypothetical protein
MAFTLWLSSEEEHLLSEVMRAEGTRTKQQAIVAALRDKASTLSTASASFRDEIQDVAGV